MPQRSLHSPVGDLTISEEDGKIVSLDWGWGAVQSDTPALRKAIGQLNEYFDGEREAFDLDLAGAPTEFAARMRAAMIAIPYGKTRTYGEVASSLGSSAQAIGQSCGANHIPIIVPCHRILAATGLGGYSGDGGLETKAALLRLENSTGQPGASDQQGRLF